jgi:redox-sensitive bicupin YhaK (pirin superfamily)
MGPAADLAGRDIGQDFAGKDGWRMYHGKTVPGFPAHPHRGFETVTIVRRGLIDHSDSMGAVSRFGAGDVQWLTAGRGIVHSEMFPLLDTANPNPLELFQIWLNLPGEKKMAAPHFRMLWSGDIPRQVFVDANGSETTVTAVAGSIAGMTAPPPPPDSWAARADSDVAIVTVRMAPGARWTLPAATGAGTRRRLYYFRGIELTVAGQCFPPASLMELRPDTDVELANGGDVAELLMLQGRPIGEPVVKYGPFVMNTEDEISQAIEDFRRRQYGEWPWMSPDPVHLREFGRFAIHADQTAEYPE